MKEIQIEEVNSISIAKIESNISILMGSLWVLCTANIGGYTFVVGYCLSLDSMKYCVCLHGSSNLRLCSCFAKARKVDKPHHVTHRT